jgi:formate hydrogenlyase subunit 3/multisubunit Na+/H+ antiporter MnhD subunit
MHLAYALLLLGFGCKAGLFPLGQLWLPDAHSIAPSPVSAMLSGVMIKTGVYGLMRTFLGMVPDSAGLQAIGGRWGLILAWLGVLTLFLGTVQALKQEDAKRLLAYSSIGQIGYIVLALGLALVARSSDQAPVRALATLALVGALYHTLNHAVFKGLLFLCAGSVLYATGARRFRSLGGLMACMPATAAAAGVASLAISGVPPLSGFASKWMIVASSILAGVELRVLVLFGIVALFTSAVTLACYVKFFGMTFASSPAREHGARPVREVPWTMLVPKAALALFCVAQGLFPWLGCRMLLAALRNSEGSAVASMLGEAGAGPLLEGRLLGIQVAGLGAGQGAAAVAVPLVVLAVLGAGFALAWLLRRCGGSRPKVAPTWLCGYQQPDDRNRYAAHGMYAAFRRAVWWTGGNPRPQ